jgi:3'-5' exonuclease
LVEQRVIIFDLETVPDIEAGRISLGLSTDATNEEVRSKMTEVYRREGQTAEQVFIKSIMHRIVCVGALYAARASQDAPWVVSRSGTVHIGQRSERDIVSAFVDSLAEAPSPQLVGFNSSSFDLPVLRYRAMAMGIPAPMIHRANGRDYWYRFGNDHLDICDFVSGFGASTRPSLSEVGSILGYSVKDENADGSKVETMVMEGRIDEVGSYCESDVIATYMVFLRLGLVTGEIRPRHYQGSIEDLINFISQRLEKRPHLERFLVFLDKQFATSRLT